jgi:hypothetical protein
MKNILPKPASDKSFGLLVAFILFLLSIYFIYSDSSYLTHTSSLTALAILISLTIPKLFAPLNFIWFKLGLLLSRIVNPVVLGMMYFILITPLALILRLFGRDELRLYNKQGSSKWIIRDQQEIDPKSFRNQY